MQQLVALRVGHSQRHRLRIRRVQVERIERQPAEVDHLARLVDRLVGGNEDVVGAPDVHLLVGAMLAGVGIVGRRVLRLNRGDDLQHLLRRRQVFRNGKAHLRQPVRPRLPAVDQLAVTVLVSFR